MHTQCRNVCTVVALLVLRAGLLAAAQPAQKPPYAAHRPLFVLLGDSLTEFGYGHHWKYKTDEKGWVALLSEEYSRKADVINRGLSGYNSRWGVQLVSQALGDLGCSSQVRQQQQPRSAFLGWLLQPQQQQVGHCNVQLMVIWFGANDLVDDSGSDSRLHVPLDEYKKNLAFMVAAARQAGVQQVVLVTPPPVDEQKWATEHNAKFSDRKNAAATQYAAGAREVAAQLGVPLLDVHKIFTQQGPEAIKQLLNDGVHLAPQGDTLVFTSLRDLLVSNPGFAGLRVNDMANHYPLYSQVDDANPGKTFKDLFERQVVPGGGSKKGGPTE